MENTLLLIDGNSLLCRAFYGYPQFITNDGRMLQGVYGFINLMNKYIEQIKPTHLAVSFDMGTPTFRHEMYADYKGTRKAPPPGLGVNFLPLQDLLTFMEICWIGIPGFEGDDILGTLSRKYEKDCKSVILSGDKDTFQLINPFTSVYLPKTVNGKKETIIYDEERFFNEFEIEPSQFIDMKALMGDTSDNIPGIKGIGPKIATKIIKEYGNIETAFEHADKIKPAKYGQLLKSNFKDAQFSKHLATIRTDIPIPVTLLDLKRTPMWTKDALDYAEKIGIRERLYTNKSS